MAMDELEILKQKLAAVEEVATELFDVITGHALFNPLENGPDVPVGQYHAVNLAMALYSEQPSSDRVAAALHERATRIVDTLLKDLNDRSGLGLDGVDDATKREIRESWIATVLRQGGEPPTWVKP